MADDEQKKTKKKNVAGLQSCVLPLQHEVG